MKVPVGTVVVDLDDADRICMHIRDGDGFEPESLDAWSKIASSGNVIDVGAYTGLFSIAAALMGATPLAIEPLYPNLHLMTKNMQANNVSFNVFEGIASDAPGPMSFWFNPNVNYTTGASVHENKYRTGRTVVDAVTIDSFNLDNVTAIKIDVEGYEDAVIRGAMATIQRDRPKILVEVLDAEARAKVQKLLPDYIVAAVLDRRNVLMIPT